MKSTTFTLAWRNIWRHPRRTLLTIAAMVFADILLIFMLGLQLGQYRMMIDNSLALVSGQMQVQAVNYLDDPKMNRSIPAADTLAEKIRTTINLEAVASRAYGFAMVSSEKRTLGVQVSGVDPLREQQVSTLPGLISSGRYLSSANANEAVIGSTLARNLKLVVGDEVTLLGSGRDGSMATAVLPLVGIFESGNREIDRQIIAIPLQSFRQIFSMGTDAHSIIIGGKRELGDKYKKSIESLIKDNDKLVLLSWEKLLPGLKQAIEADFFSAWLMYAVLIILVAFSMLNTILMSVLERTHEFGILLALGVRHSKLGKMIFTESTLLALTGMIIGIASGSLLTFYFSKTGISYPGLEEMSARFNLPPVILPEVSLRTVIPGPLAVFLASALSSIYPVWHIRKLNPVQAMQAA